MAEAAKWFRKSAEQGDNKGQYCLASCLESGRGVPRVRRDKRLSLSTPLHLTTAPDYPGRNVLCDTLHIVRTLRYFCSSLGNGGPRTTVMDPDYAEAAHWYRLAAEQGHGQAQNQLAQLLEAGRGCDKNLAEAGEWFLQAAEQGLTQAQYHLGRCYSYGPLSKNEIQ
eukprot:gene3420-4299_t